MAWNTELMPLEYLEKRLRYYKRRYTKWNNWLKKTVVVKDNKITMKMLRKPKGYSVADIKKAVATTHKKVVAFEEAIKKLNQ